MHRSLADALGREGLSEIPTVGKFDPYAHQALLAQPSSEAEGTVIQVLQKGYTLGDSVLRPGATSSSRPGTMAEFVSERSASRRRRHPTS